MLITPAFASNAMLGTGSSGGAIALSIIIAVAIALLLVNVALKKLRRRKLTRRDASGE